uniref:Uncharacterized protein n=1 Tax=Rhizophora mucronata TaxID=61149 RepID=A0A2P2NKD5_RHIMU
MLAHVWSGPYSEILKIKVDASAGPCSAR